MAGAGGGKVTGRPSSTRGRHKYCDVSKCLGFRVKEAFDAAISAGMAWLGVRAALLTCRKRHPPFCKEKKKTWKKHIKNVQQKKKGGKKEKRDQRGTPRDGLKN